MSRLCSIDLIESFNEVLTPAGGCVAHSIVLQTCLAGLGLKTKSCTPREVDFWGWAVMLTDCSTSGAGSQVNGHSTSMAADREVDRGHANDLAATGLPKMTSGDLSPHSEGDDGGILQWQSSAAAAMLLCGLEQNCYLLLLY